MNARFEGGNQHTSPIKSIESQESDEDSQSDEVVSKKKNDPLNLLRDILNHKVYFVVMGVVPSLYFALIASYLIISSQDQVLDEGQGTKIERLVKMY